jgi:hypothetical protein
MEKVRDQNRCFAQPDRWARDDAGIDDENPSLSHRTHNPPPRVRLDLVLPVGTGEDEIGIPSRHVFE